MSLFVSFALIESRLSKSFLPLAIAISSLASPFSLMNNKVGMRVNPFSRTFILSFLSSRAVSKSFLLRLCS